MSGPDDTEVDPAPEGTALTRREGTPQRSAPRQPTAVDFLKRGTLVGRYVILDVLGEGGMGVVYSAFDPELDRKVAIKLLQAQPGGSHGGQAWLLREAQALAKLSHPNVVAVFDVGSVPGDQVFIAMELVEGTTLRKWLAESPRAWREIVGVMRAAGAGLAAAHAKGLVHRDFKPDNVIVGKDGRVRVMDFGLARLGEREPEGERPRESHRALSEPLTVAGAVVGTPAYMSPEIYRGEPADARADQFAFGITLYEALYGARPYTPGELRSGALPGPRPATDRAPAAIAKIVLRAIATRSDDRYPTIDLLLADLAIDPSARRRRAAIAIGSVLACAGLVGGALGLRHHKSQLCTGSERRLAGVWDPAAKQTIHAAFAASKAPFAERAFAGLEHALDAYADDWRRTVVESCEATRVRGEQTEEVLSLREACLDQRLEELRAVSQVLATANAALVEKGDKVASELEPIARCSNVTALRAPGAIPEQIRPRVDDLTKQLAQAKADLIAGKYLSVLTTVQSCLDGAKQVGWEPLIADALSLRGVTLLTTGNVPDALTAFTEATWSAVRGKRADVVALASLSAAMAATDAGGRPGEARIWLGLAIAAATSIGTDRALERRRLEVEGLIDVESGDLLAGIAAYEKALAVTAAAFGADDPQVWVEEQWVGGAYAKAGAYERAKPHFERALALRQQSVGPDHPDIAMLLSNLGVVYEHTRDPKQARASFERAIALRERFYGKLSPVLVPSLDNYGELLRGQGDIAGALASQERAIDMAKAIPGPTHPMYHQLATDYADTLVAAGRFADARQLFDRVLSLEEANRSSVLPATQSSRAELALAEHAWAEADGFARSAIAGFEAAGGTSNPELWRPLTRLARAKIGLGTPADARPLLERAVAIGEQMHVTADDLAGTRELLSQLR